MTKKDYIVIANGIKRAFRHAKGIEHNGIIFASDCIIVELAKENPKFNSIKFWAYINSK